MQLHTSMFFPVEKCSSKCDPLLLFYGEVQLLPMRGPSVEGAGHYGTCLRHSAITAGVA